jgi:protein SMG5
VTKSWNCQPLPEDIHLRSFSALRLEHASLNFDINKLNQLSLYDEHLLRLCNLRRFGYMIASFSKVHSGAENLNFFEYEVSKQAFNAPILQQETLSTATTTSPVMVINKDEKTVESQAKVDKRVQLMKSMAQMRLEAEISQLESSTHKNDSQWSPYIVPDTLALCYNLKLVQELTRMNKFILIIPLVVIDNLDRMKKDNARARDTIRWLEQQFKQGNRFMRAQNQNEKISSNENSGLVHKKKDFEAWCFLQLIDCCKYFQQEANGGYIAEGSNRQNMVTLLTSNEKEAVEKFQEPSFRLALNYAKENGEDIFLNYKSIF